MNKEPIRITVTGAAGQIGYALLFRLAAGDMLGKKQPIALQLLEVPAAMKPLEGTVMELLDSAFPLLHSVHAHDRPEEAFLNTEYAFLVGAKPRGPGMERRDLLEGNAAIFREQGRAIDAMAARHVKVLVVGNPANTNALITADNAPSLDKNQFSSMTRLDHNRALAQLAQKLEVSVSKIKRMIIWGNHSTTQYPDISHAMLGSKKIKCLIDRSWYERDFAPRVANRGAEVIATRGASSAASAANAAIDHMRDWALGAGKEDWVSMGVASDGSYGIPEGIFYSFPTICADGQYEIVPDLNIDEFSRERMQITQKELEDERTAVQHMLCSR